MTLQDLADIVEPAAVSWRPQTGGWILLVALTVIGGGLVVYVGLRRHAANRYRREGLTALASLSTLTPGQVSGVLKRVAMVRYPRHEVATLHGDDWVAFLERTGRAAPSQSVAALLADGPYERPGRESPELAAFARHWIAGHRAPRQGGS